MGYSFQARSWHSRQVRSIHLSHSSLVIIVCSLPSQLFGRVSDLTLVLQLALFKLCEVVVCYDAEVDDVLANKVVVAFNLAAESHDCHSSISHATLELLDHIVRTALGLPVGLFCRAVVLVVLGGNK